MANKHLAGHLLILAALSLPNAAALLLLQQQSPPSPTQQQQNHIAQSNPIATPHKQQHNNILHFVVTEDAPNGTYLGNIRSNDGQTPFTVVSMPPTTPIEHETAIRVNLENGDLFTNSVLDREKCERYHFVAIVSSPFSEIKCTLTVIDVNDNAPMFRLNSPNETNFVVDIPEGQRGLRRPLPVVIDYDSPQFGIQEFRIVSGNTPPGTFQLVEHAAPERSQSNTANEDSSSSLLAGDNPQLLQQLAQQDSVLVPSQPVMQSSSSSSAQYFIELEVLQTLDRENQSSYQLTIEAHDKGQPSLVGILKVTVNVLDINDNDPVFTRKNYECRISEDTVKGTFITKVQALDVDLESNGQISYFIKRHSTSSQPASSSINSNSSDNSEVSTGRYFTNSNKQQRSQQVVQGGSVTANKQQQQITQQRTQASNELYVDNAANTQDAFKSNKQTFGAQEQMFEIDTVKGEIYLAGQLDYETDQMHELLVEARDHGKPSRSAHTIVKVFVIDVHEEPQPSTINRSHEEKRQLAQVASSEASRSELSAGRPGADMSEFTSNYFSLINWLAQINSSLLFVIVLVALFAIAFPVCLVKIKSRQPEADYNDTAALTLTLNNGQAKQSPNHSISNEHSKGSNDSHHRHHVDQHRAANGSFSGLNGSNGPYKQNGTFGFQYIDSDHYHNPHPLLGHSHGGGSGMLPLPPLHSAQQPQLPPTPCNAPASMFAWPQTPGSTIGCCPGASGNSLHGPGGNTMDCAPTSPPLDRRFDLGAPAQLVYSHDWHGSYNWDYLTDWVPDYHTLMSLMQDA